MLSTLECSLTTACNLACSYCHQGQRPPRSMPWTVVKASVERLVATEAEEPTLALTGGEPLLVWSLVRRAIEYAREASSSGKYLRIALTTNGLLLDLEKTRFLVAHDVEMQISMDGVKEAHEIRAPGTFKHLEHMLTRMRRDHPSWFRKSLSLGMTLTTANLPFLGRSVGFLLGRGVESLRLAPLLTNDKGWGSESETELERQVALVFDICLEHHRRTGAVPFELFRRPATLPQALPDRPVCGVNAPETQAVGVDGTIGGCSLLLAQKAGGTKGAPALRQWVGQTVWPGLRRDRYSSYGICRDCEFVEECLVCPVASASIPGNTDPLRVPDFNCAFNRILGRYRLQFPALAGAEDYLTGNDLLPSAMTDLAVAVGLG